MTGYEIKNLIDLCMNKLPESDTARAFHCPNDPLDYNPIAHKLLSALQQIQRDVKILKNKWMSNTCPQDDGKGSLTTRPLDYYFLEKLFYLMDLVDDTSPRT